MTDSPKALAFKCFGLFKKEDKHVLYTIPDFPNLHGFGETMEEAIEDAKHLIALELSVRDSWPNPSTLKEIQKFHPNNQIFAIQITKELIQLNSSNH